LIINSDLDLLIVFNIKNVIWTEIVLCDVDFRVHGHTRVHRNLNQDN